MKEHQYPPTNPSSKPNSNVTSRFSMLPTRSSQTTLSANEVSRILDFEVRDGEVVQGTSMMILGRSRMDYIPFEKKVITYENRRYV